VLFLAAEPNLAAVKRSPVEATHTMTTGLINCLTKFNNSHFIYFSSSMVYGNWDSNLANKYEYENPSPIDLYGRLKLVGEGLVKELHNNWTIVRPTAVYGEGDDPNRVLPTFDVVQAVRLMIERKSKNQIYNVSYSQSHALDIIAEYICTLVGTGSYTISQRDYDYPKRGALDIQKARTELGYHPRISVQVGIKKLLEEL
jgi:nucleoside-diphosphate-sugar epimerase